MSIDIHHNDLSVINNYTFKLIQAECFIPVSPKFLASADSISYALFQQLSTLLLQPIEEFNGKVVSFNVNGIVKESKIEEDGSILVNTRVEFLVFNKHY
ncbi:hypothetical protein NUSPORA_02503 [Nucleospora cyclopteri]